ncbi:MAG: sodium:calcium antiporter [Firmicutes bacterium]|jgi:cation:H+ antiporter|nr:sodium:calcium antiporter [Bacillota bacterium]
MVLSQIGIYLIFIVSLVAVTKGADWLVEGAVGLARIWGVPQIIVGATIVSLGTTLPETLISSFAAAQGKGSVVLGTSLGSILFNTAVILGLASVIRPPQVKDKDTFFKAGTMIGVLVLLGILASDHMISRFDSLVLAVILIFYLGSNIWAGINTPHGNENNYSRSDLWRNVRDLVVGTILVVLGARYLLDSGVEIARILGVPEAIIAVTLFAVGSSLPEFITATTAAIKGHTGLVLGNIFGANTLNIIFVIAISGLIRPFAVEPSVLTMDIPAALFMMAVLVLPAFFTKRITRVQGAVTVIAYFAYIIFLVI